jgi:K+/H+ antiporter YhaU regulatory subunit KhtT
MVHKPMPPEVLEEDDVIVAIGKKDDLKRMNHVL